MKLRSIKIGKKRKKSKSSDDEGSVESVEMNSNIRKKRSISSDVSSDESTDEVVDYMMFKVYELKALLKKRGLKTSLILL